MKFTVQHEDPKTEARIGRLETSHGMIQTPIFMPVGTLGVVKAVHQRELCEDLSAEIILGNTFHLYLRPGIELLRKAGGLHSFMRWERPILTDSGGYQVYSLAKSRQITEEGVEFAAPIDGSKHLFTSENVIDMQRGIGSDIMMVLDECTPAPCSYAYAKASMERTHRWLQRCRKRWQETTHEYNHTQALFPIVQGSTYKDLRTQSANIVAAADLPGNAIGGVCHPTGQLYEVTAWVCDILPKEKPRYLMGVGTPQDIAECVALGVDMFDCVLPARNGRNGYLFTTQGIMHIKNKRWREDFTPIDVGLQNYASNHYTKAYLHHLMRIKERLAAQIATLHNLAFYRWLIKQIRLHIQKGDFLSWKRNVIPQLMQKVS